MDSVRLTGTLGPTPGDVIPDPSGANRVTYIPLPGVHGVDRFEYSVTDCLSYGSPNSIAVVIPAPLAAFSSSQNRLLTVVLGGNSGSALFDLAVEVSLAGPTIFSYFSGRGKIHLELRGLRGELSSLRFGGALLEVTGSTSYILPEAWGRQLNVSCVGTGSAEVWLSSEGGGLTWRLQVEVSTPSRPVTVELIVFLAIIVCLVLAAKLSCFYYFGYVRARRGSDSPTEGDTKELLALFANPQLNRQAQAVGLRPLSFVILQSSSRAAGTFHFWSW